MTSADDCVHPIVARALLATAPVAAAREASERVEIGGLWGSSASLAAGLLARDKTVLVAPSADAAEAAALDLGQLFPSLRVVLVPVEDDGLGDGPERRANLSERLVALDTLRDDDPVVLVVAGASLLEEIATEAGRALEIRRGARLDRDAVSAELLDAGFQREALVAAPGEFSVRGDILDVYPWASPFALRVELDDDVVEEVRRFEVDTQRSVEVLSSVTLRLTHPDTRPRGSRAQRLPRLLPESTRVLRLDPARLRDRLVEWAFEHDHAPREVEDALDVVAAFPGADLHPLDLGDPERDVSIGSVGGARTDLADAIGAWRAERRDVVVLAETDAECERLEQRLAERGIATGPSLKIVAGRLTSGFRFPGAGPVLVHHHELLGRRAVRRRRPRRVVATRALDSIAELHAGDYVVHLVHGVAIFRGVQRLARDQGEEDFLVLEFEGETTLYVPASRIDLVERFIGAGASTPKLDRIGGKTWARKKARVQKAVEDLASQLLEIQARRTRGEGIAFPAEDELEARFESLFPYRDTPDQHRAWREVRADMERGAPMDRLLVGDVGFGKTEIAVRAAYKAVLAGKQVAVLVPTTILAEQHFETFARRTQNEPLRVEALSRFRSPGDVKQVIADVADGKVDILIGTHRLLSRDVKFHDLGLVIVDEEQRFGVTHKERLKQLRATVDLLTLSATPIPRTLHMAMSGLRDISSIQTPPPGRRPVITKVGYEDEALIRRAVLHELDRGGQTFVLHNRVQSIGRVHDLVHELVPSARVDVAHGQMGARELQSAVEAFSGGETDVLVCTSIIESGIDIPRANTIIVTDAHRFGLADLHQLRGRVGREDSQAYAFFLVPHGSLPDVSRDRLKAIEEFASLGSGLPIALRDLELRGAGNLLGAEQSGHILTVGYDLYCRLLQSAIRVKRGEPVAEEPGETEVELGLAAYLPSDYVPDEAARMNLLRRMAHAGRRKLDVVERELADRFGRPPEPVRALVGLFRLRRACRNAGVASIQVDGLGGLLLAVSDPVRFHERNPFDEHETAPLGPGRLRVTVPSDVSTPAARLRYLLDRFSVKATPTAR